MKPELCPYDSTQMHPLMSVPTQAGTCTLYRCPQCKRNWTTPLHSEEELEKLYLDRGSNDFIPLDNSFVAKLKDSIARMQMRNIFQITGRIPNSLIDFGTGNGRYAVAAEAAGCKSVRGVDWHETAPGALLRAKASYSSMSDFFNSEQRHDFIFLRHVLEHAGSPDKLLRQLLNKLEPGGHIYIEVPNFNSALCRSLGKHAQGLYLPFHRCHFTRESLDLCTNSNGFKTVAAGMKTMPKIADQINKHFPACPRIVAQVTGISLLPAQLLLELLMEPECLWTIATPDQQ